MAKIKHFIQFKTAKFWENHDDTLVFLEISIRRVIKIKGFKIS